MKFASVTTTATLVRQYCMQRTFKILIHHKYFCFVPLAKKSIDPRKGRKIHDFMALTEALGRVGF